MGKTIAVLALTFLFSQESDAFFGRARRAAAARSSGSTGSVYGGGSMHFTPSVGRFPETGDTKIQYGWVYRFERRTEHSGTWYPVYPENENPSDYVDGYPVDGLVRYRNGEKWTYDRRTNTWYTDWEIVR